MRKLSRSFVNLRLDTRNRRNEDAERLHVRGNASYVLLLDSRGREVFRLRSDTPKGDISVAAVVGRMEEMLSSKRDGRIGLELLLRLLEDANPQTRADAVSMMQRMGSKAAPAVSSLIRALGDGSSDVARGAAKTLGVVGPACRAARGGLEAVLRDHTADGNLRMACARTLGSLDEDGETVQALMAQLESPVLGVRLGAIAGLGEVGGSAAAAVPALIALLRHDRDLVRRGAASALGSMGASAEAALPALRAVEKRERSRSSTALRVDVASAARRAIEHIERAR